MTPRTDRELAERSARIVADLAAQQRRAQKLQPRALGDGHPTGGYAVLLVGLVLFIGLVLLVGFAKAAG